MSERVMLSEEEIDRLATVANDSTSGGDSSSGAIYEAIETALSLQFSRVIAALREERRRLLGLTQHIEAHGAQDALSDFADRLEREQRERGR